MRAIIIHGYGSHPDANWLRWLKLRLQEAGVEAIAPKFPTPELQSVKNWMTILEQHGFPDENTILIGHSLGGSFLLSILEHHKAKAAFLIASPYGMMRNDIDHFVADFTNKNFDWDAIRKNCPEFHLYYSDDDPFVPARHGENLASKLGIPFRVLPGSGHFMTNSFPRLLEDIKKLL